MPNRRNSELPPYDYWHEARRPLACLVFVTPFLVFYEVGVLLLGPQAVRNAADVWLRALLDLLGFGPYFLLPVLTCAVLLGWNYTAQQPWRVRSSVLYGMFLESLLFGFLLLLIAGWQYSLLRSLLPLSAGETGPAASLVAVMVGYVGAGIYEELLFRLLLLPAVIGCYRLIGMSPRLSLVAAIITTSLLFSAAHYQFELVLMGNSFHAAWGEPFDWASFVFRFLAGLMFSLLFLYRGFGIAVGSHALYDLFTLLS